jgi:hypothetical protein
MQNTSGVHTMPATCTEASVQAAASAFVRQIGNLSNKPEVRDRLLKTAVHEVACQLLDEFRDPYRLAEQLAIMSQLAWLGAEAVQASRIARPATLNPPDRVGGLDNDRTVLAPGSSRRSHRDRGSSPMGPWPSWIADAARQVRHGLPTPARKLIQRNVARRFLGCHPC